MLDLDPLSPLARDADGLSTDLRRHLVCDLGRDDDDRSAPHLYEATALAIRHRLAERANATRRAAREVGGRQAYYLSLEYLLGRTLRNAIVNLDLEPATAEAIERMGLSLEEVADEEQDAGLGNGGLGRLAACLLDSCATLGLPVTGYGIRYRYGIFRQRIVDGYQIEEPDLWLRHGHPWEVERRELIQRVRFGGRTAAPGEPQRWVDTDDVLAIPYDIPIPGYRNNIVNTLRLWAAGATDEFDLAQFNEGSYSESVAAQNAAENISMVLYPNDDTERGKELRLRQQYFLVAASLGDRMREWREVNGDDATGFADRHCFQLNDTHPSVAVAELMRILMDECGLSFDDAWRETTSCMAYTNHTLLPEALETWPVALFERLLPRPLEIISEIDRRLLARVAERWPGDKARARRMSLFDDEREQIRMAHLAIAGSYSVNGVSAAHSDLLRHGLLRDFHDLWPERFNSKTNGVTQRRWLAVCNPALSELVTEAIGDGWVTDLEQLQLLAPLADDAEFGARWRAVKRANKERLATMVERRADLAIDPEALADVHVKRIHEYKRQLLNLLHVVHLYARITRGDTAGMVPRTVVIGGKAASAYVVAKRIIKLINAVGGVVNADPRASSLLRVAFVPNYDVSAMETICPAAELSEQISTAGKEASGTGNMKFMLNGALTIGTLDGANIEIRDAVGDENFFLFGLTAEEVVELRADYRPKEIIAAEPDLAEVIELIASGLFNPGEPGIFDDLLAALASPNDPWMTAADFASFIAAHQRAAEAYGDQQRWTRMSILNTAAAGRFSSDRTIREYDRDIWRLTPVE